MWYTHQLNGQQLHDEGEPQCQRVALPARSRSQAALCRRRLRSDLWPPHREVVQHPGVHGRPRHVEQLPDRQQVLCRAMYKQNL